MSTPNNNEYSSNSSSVNDVTQQVAGSVLDFVLHVKNKFYSSTPVDRPIIVHCSAGIGRSGCFIAALLALEQLEKTNEIDISRIVASIRRDRGGMVQTLEQFKFLHKLIIKKCDIERKEEILVNK